MPNGCDPTTAIGAFLNFPKLRLWCASNGVTDFGPYGGVPSGDGRPAPPNPPPRPQPPVPQVLISIPQRPEEDSRDAGEDFDYDDLDNRNDYANLDVRADSQQG